MPNQDFYTIDHDLAASLAGSRPAMFVFLDGYMDAGQIGTQLKEFLLEDADAAVLARFDPDLVHDYRARRPQLIFDTDSWKDVDEPELMLQVAHDGKGAPYLVLAGPEPDFRWHGLRDALIDLVEQLDVSLVFAAHGVPMAVPHTREVPLTTHATDIELRTENPRWVDRLTVPGSFASYLEFCLGRVGRSAMGIAAHVPHYLTQGTFTRPALEVAGRMAAATGLDLPLEKLAEKARANDETIGAEVADNPEAAEVIGALEHQFDEFQAAADEQLPSAEELGAAFQQFLAQQDGPDQR